MLWVHSLWYSSSFATQANISCWACVLASFSSSFSSISLLFMSSAFSASFFNKIQTHIKVCMCTWTKTGMYITTVISQQHSYSVHRNYRFYIVCPFWPCPEKWVPLTLERKWQLLQNVNVLYNFDPFFNCRCFSLQPLSHESFCLLPEALTKVFYLSESSYHMQCLLSTGLHTYKEFSQWKCYLNVRTAAPRMV